MEPELLELEEMLKLPSRRRIDEVRIAAILPAYNEQEGIAASIESILSQTRPPDALFVIVNNSTDDSFSIAREYNGSHQLRYRDQVFTCVVSAFDMGVNPGKKVGALNFGWALAEDYDYILGVDGDTTLDPRCVEHLAEEMVDDSRIGGISAIYGFDQSAVTGAMQSFLVRSQRFQFAGFNMDNLLRSRNMAVLGGQCSLLSVAAMRRAMHDNHQNAPWVTDSEIEDSLLSLQLRSAGYRTKISASARANVGPMTTVRALDAQQVKWNAGGVELILAQPLHPNLRLRWRENLAMLTNLGTRVLFGLLAAAALSIHAFEFAWWWSLPPVVSVLVNLRLARSIRGYTWQDVAYALLLIPGETYMVMRGLHFLKAWAQVLGKQEHDNWAAQARAESGGSMSTRWILPFVGVVATVAALAFAWAHLNVALQSGILAAGWVALAVLTIMQTLAMVKKLLRNQRGFRV